MDRQDSQPEPMDTEPSNHNHTQDNGNNNLDDKKERKRKIKLNKEEEKENLMKSGFIFISAFQLLLQKKKANKDIMLQYMQRVLHSIFFFGHINVPQISPKEFIPATHLEQFKKFFPKPFQEYKTHFPCQTPYSILLEYMTEAVDSKMPDSFIQELETVNKLLLIFDEEGNQPVANDFAFTASVIAYSYIKDPESARVLKMFYGSSMSYKGKMPRKIMIAISALYVWDKAISYAVCCGDNGPAIKFPDHVHCNAYKFYTQQCKYKPVPPCIKCNKMFDVQFNPRYEVTNQKQDWGYGNCAENESLSKLLQSNRDVRRAICTVNDNNEETMNREDIENKFRDNYEKCMEKKVNPWLISLKFRVDPADWQLFTPAMFSSLPSYH